MTNPVRIKTIETYKDGQEPFGVAEDGFFRQS